MRLLVTFPDTINLDAVSGSHAKQSGKIIKSKKRLLIKDKLDTDSADSDAGIVPPEIKSQVFNKSTLSHNKNWQRRMGNTYGKMPS